MWQRIPDAESYTLSIPNAQGKESTVTVKGADCGEKTCQFTDANLVPRDQKLSWKVTVNFPAGGTVEAPAQTFSSVRAAQTVGLFRPSSGTFFLSLSNKTAKAAIVIKFGEADDLPVAGDWDGDGIDTVGVFRPRTKEFLLLAENAPNAKVALQFTFPLPEAAANDIYTPIVGDWDGDGKDSLGVMRVRQRKVTFFLKNGLEGALVDHELTSGFNYGDTAVGVAGDWNGDGTDTVGVYLTHARQYYLEDVPCLEAECTLNRKITVDLSGVPGKSENPVTGDWQTFKQTGIGMFRGSTFYLLDIVEGRNPRTDRTPTTILFGTEKDRPIMGVWQGQAQ